MVVNAICMMTKEILSIHIFGSVRISWEFLWSYRDKVSKFLEDQFLISVYITNTLLLLLYKKDVCYHLGLHLATNFKYASRK